MAYVIKIKYEDTLRRINLQGADSLSFGRLECKIRDLFKLEAESSVRVTYVDQDGDTITMADDQDLVDALEKQALNPLRLKLSIVKPKQVPSEVVPSSLEIGHDASLNQVLRSLSFDSVKRVLTEPSVKERLKGTPVSGHQVAEMAESILKSVTSTVKALEAGSRSGAGSTVVRSSGPEPVQVQSVVSYSPPGKLRPEAPYSPVRKGVVDREESSPHQVYHTGVQCDVCGMSPIAGPRFKSIRKLDYDLCPSCFKDFGNFSDYTRIDRPLFRPRHLYSPGFGRMRCPAMISSGHSGRPANMRGPYGSRPEGRSFQGPVHHVNGGLYGGKMDARFVQDVTILDGTELAPGTPFKKIWRLRNSGTLPWAPQTKLVHVGGDELGSVFIVPLELPEQGLAPDEEIEAAVDLIAPEKPGRYVSHWRLASPTGPKFGHRVWVLIQVVPKEEAPSPVLSSAGSDVSREAFVKASHEAVTAEPETKITYPTINLLDSLMDVEDPFSGLKMTDSEVESIVSKSAEDFTVFPEIAGRGDTVAVENSELGGGFSMVEMPSNGVSRVNSMPSSPKGLAQVLSPATSAGEEWVNRALSVGADEYGDGYEEVNRKVLGAGIDEEDEESLTTAVPVTAADDHSEVVEVNVEEPVVTEHRDDFAEENVDSKAPVIDDGDDEEEVINSGAPSLGTLSSKLEAMGFADRKLNMELLARNKMDLRRTLDDLFAAAEWDPILEELEEMGFNDTAMNRRLMFKNNGSVKRVVKELVQMYK